MTRHKPAAEAAVTPAPAPVTPAPAPATAEAAPASAPSPAPASTSAPVSASAPAAASAPTDAAPADTAAAATPAAAPTSRTTDIVAGQGGVMTDEAGVITGEVTLRTELSGDQVTLHAQYKDADEWYVVTNAKTTVKDPADLDAVHAMAVGLLNRPEG
ncbi:hypothetical protein GCM10020358_47920 [Amorphoplanes nipponensis]|uniref:Uncharacterized protein n=1 Tax=Actinoplanes nipponensis TaxID=135950 RepID=A0A919MLG3_9ACTN|nr:hypothetical protein [Actinoplanes nipponensis]GIE49491.1 hypothetical protein Ani05nite_30250 [Actinoplanes nipponensis]